MKKRMTTEDKVRFVRDQVRRSNGQFFGVTFIKKDGTIRVMSCRTGVAKHTKGVGFKYDPHSRGLLPVWEKQAEAGGDETYRMVNLDSVTRLTIAGKEYHFEDEEK